MRLLLWARPVRQGLEAAEGGGDELRASESPYLQGGRMKRIRRWLAIFFFAIAFIAEGISVMLDPNPFNN